MSIFGTPQNPGNVNYPVSTASATVNTAIGDLIVVFFSNVISTLGATVTCSDSAGNTYTAAATINPGALPDPRWFYCLQATHASSSNVVTVNSGTTSQMLVIRVWDFPCTGTPIFDYIAPTLAANYVAIQPPGYAYPNGATGTDELVCVAGVDTSRTSTWGGPPGSGFTLDPAITGNASYLNAMGSEYGVFANPNTAPILNQHQLSINGAHSAFDLHVTLASTVTVGNQIMVQFVGPSGYTFTTVDDSLGNVYHNASIGGGGNVQNYYAKVTTGGTANVRVAGISAVAWFLANVMEIAGSPGADPVSSENTGTTGNPNTITMGASRSPHEIVTTGDFNEAPGHAVTFTASTSTLVDQTGIAADGFIALLTDPAATTGTVVHPAVSTSVAADPVTMSGISWFSSATPFMYWTGASNFVAAIGFKAGTTFSIFGNAGIAGATVAYTGTSSGSVTADGSGNYIIPNLANGSYTLTPSFAGETFSPASQGVTISGANVTGVNFTAMAGGLPGRFWVSPCIIASVERGE